MGGSSAMKIKYLYIPMLFVVLLALGTAIPGQAQTPTETPTPYISDNLTSCWSLNEESGTRHDAVGDMDLTEYNTVGQVGGRVGSAAAIVALNSEVLSVDDISSLRTDQDFSLVAWVNKSSSDEGQMLGFSGDVGIAYIVSMSTVTTVYRGQSEEEYVFPAITPNEWHLLLLEKSGDQICLGIDDGNISCQTDITETGIPNQFFIGGGQSAYYDEVAFWQRSLSSNEQLWLFNSGVGRTCTEITAPIVTPTSSVQQLINLSSGDQAVISRTTSYGDIAIAGLLGLLLVVMVIFGIVWVSERWYGKR